MNNATVDQLKQEWDDAKKLADSLSIDFRKIEDIRRHEAEARRDYLEAVAAAEYFTQPTPGHREATATG